MPLTFLWCYTEDKKKTWDLFNGKKKINMFIGLYAFLDVTKSNLHINTINHWLYVNIWCIFEFLDHCKDWKVWQGHAKNSNKCLLIRVDFFYHIYVMISYIFPIFRPKYIRIHRFCIFIKKFPSTSLQGQHHCSFFESDPVVKNV